MRIMQMIGAAATFLAATTIAGDAAPADSAPAASAPAAAHEKLLDPAALNAQTPETYRARFATTKGDFVIEVTRAWAPHGADRFYNLVANGFYDDCRFFRVVYGFMAQFGIHGDPAISSVWREARIPDDPVTQSNKRGYVTFATAGPNTRTTQVFINYADKNTMLDGQGFAPFGVVVEGMEVVNKLFSAYGEAAPKGRGPDQGRIQKEGNAYLEKSFAKLDSIRKATVEPSGP